MYYTFDEYGEKEYCYPIVINGMSLVAKSYKKENLENIEEAILEVLNDKAFDGICRFEKVKK